MTRKPLMIAVLLALGACALPTDRDANNNWVLRSYDVPADDAMGMLIHLKDLFILNKGDDKGSTYTQIARASISPNGRLVVIASKEMQAGVADLVASLATHPAPKPRTVNTDYWLVLGSPAKGDAVIPAGLGPIADALKEVAKTTGPQTFTLWEQVHMASGGFESEVTGKHVQVRQTALPGAGGDVLLDTRINAGRMSQYAGPSEVKTKVRIAPEQTVVLAQSGFSSDEHAEPSPADSPVTLYYLVRASIPNGDSTKR